MKLNLRSFSIPNILLVMALLLLLDVTPASAWKASFLHAADGDSFTVRRLDSGQKLNIRLYGIDAPEQRQAFSQVARRNLIALLKGRDLDVHPMYSDPYHRVVAVVYAGSRKGEAPICVNAEQLCAGMAWYYPSYCKAPFCAKWKRIEQKARTERRGLWQDRAPVPPWQWRRQSLP